MKAHCHKMVNQGRNYVAECVRCYECRSDIQRNCGDPFVGNVNSVECSQVTTKPTTMCFKTSQNVGGQYITVRGCAPFDTDTFGAQFQRQAGGTYWKGQNSFSGNLAVKASFFFFTVRHKVRNLCIYSINPGHSGTSKIP